MTGGQYTSHLDRMRAQVARPEPVAPVKPGQHEDFFASYGNPIKAAMINPVLGAIVAVANHLSPTVRQHAPFTAVDDKPAPVTAAAFGDFLRLGRQLFHGIDARTFSKAALDRSQTPITERDYSPQEIAQLQEVVRRAQAAGRQRIDRADYQNTMESLDANGGMNPVGEWGNTVGRAILTTDRHGQAHVVDKYDFNRYDNYGAGVGNPLELMEPAMWYGRRALPSGLRGLPVDIKLPPLRRGMQGGGH